MSHPSWYKDLQYDRIVKFAARTENDVCFETKQGELFVVSQEQSDLNFEHLPDCDSFDWQPETFPQWYLHESGNWGHIAYVCRDSKNTYFCVDTCGRKTEPNVLTWAKYHDAIVRSGGWKQVTQAEAEPRVKKPEPVESPDDWVEFDGRLISFPRYEIDELKHEKDSAFEPAIQAWYRKTQQWQMVRIYYKVRCRRRDLPPLPQDTPKREYVRCYLNESTGTITLLRNANAAWSHLTVLQHDGTGFYVEDGK